MKCIAGVFDHLSSCNRSLILESANKSVQITHWTNLVRVVCTYDRKRRIEEICDGGAFPQKLWIETNQEILARLLSTCPLESRHYNLFSGSWKHRAAQNDPVECLLVLQ